MITQLASIVLTVLAVLLVALLRQPWWEGELL